MFFTSLPICLAARRAGDVRPAALLPMAAQTGDQSCRQGWAGLGRAGRGERGGTLRGFGSALIRVIISAGTHTHTHTLALVFAAGVSPDSRGFPWSEVIMCPAILHGELRYHSGCRINSLSSLCEHSFKACMGVYLYVCLCLRAPEEATGTERDRKAG